MMVPLSSDAFTNEYRLTSWLRILAAHCGLTVGTDAEATISQHLAARALLDALLPEPDNGGASC